VSGEPGAQNGLARLLLTPGEPAGIGPDLVLALATEEWPAALAAVADLQLLRERAQQLKLAVRIRELGPAEPVPAHRQGELAVRPLAAAVRVQAGALDPRNAPYVLATLRAAAGACLAGQADALVTAPVHKGVINDAGIAFTGHTEFLAALCGAPTPVMLLAAGSLRVALATTHLPLREVADAITRERLERVLRVLHHDLRARFALPQPRILVCGLNPHAGEGGHLGREELEVIAPVLEALRREGLDLRGPLPADTLFTPRQLAQGDAVLAMYHDQGLPVLKHAGFGEAVNLTLGLPILRTSVDHGTALELAGSGQADPGSLRAALRMAMELARPRGPG
jgi:4-hydroxythreonine-4-phosphate dehydrogenase